LRHGDPETVLTALGVVPAGEARDTALGYLTTRRSQIADRDFVVVGGPIGSGCVERAPKGVVQQRLNQRGMRWSRPVADGMLALRVVDANDRWAARWRQVGPHQRTAHQAHTPARQVARRARPPKLVQHGKPTADHCWRRFRLTGSPRHRHAM
jgi:hypothetical protein